jgi:hypothetical protein
MVIEKGGGERKLVEITCSWCWWVIFNKEEFSYSVFNYSSRSSVLFFLFLIHLHKKYQNIGFLFANAFVVMISCYLKIIIAVRKGCKKWFALIR